MTAEQREQIRYSLLRYTAAAERFASTRLLLQFLKAEGHGNLTLGEVAGELQYLIDKGLVMPIEKVISPENRCVRITAEGRDFMAQHNLE